MQTEPLVHVKQFVEQTSQSYVVTLKIDLLKQEVHWTTDATREQVLQEIEMQDVQVEELSK